MINCTKCNAANENVAVFCGECGNPIKTATASSTAQPLIQQTATAPEPVKKAEIHCRNCGKTLFADAYACTGCGLPPYKGKNHCPQCGAGTHPEAIICVKCGIKLEETIMPQPQKNPLNSIFGQSGLTNNNQNSSQPNRSAGNNVVIIGGQKSMGVAILLTFFFGPLGLLYVSVAGGLILMFVGLIGLIIWPLLLLPWLGSIIWAIIAVSNQNAKLNNTANNFINKPQ